MSTILSPARWLTLDAFRGFTIALMILVNHPGHWDTTFPILKHAEWDGCTLADLVFPFFLLAVGITTALSLERAKSKGASKGDLLVKALKRATMLIAIGLALNFLHDPHFDTVRVPGVLQRIGLSYLLCVLFFLYTTPRVWLVSTAVIWLLAQYLVSYGQAPGGLPWYQYFDALALGKHVYGHTAPGDPEGIFSTITSLPTLFAGLFIAVATIKTPGIESSRRFLGAGLASAATGLVLHLTVQPMNKFLWNASYVLFTTGLAMLLMEVLGHLLKTRWGAKAEKPLLALGANSILLYILSELAGYGLNHRFVPDTNLRRQIFPFYEGLFPAGYASLFYTFSLVGLFVVLSLWLYRRKIFLKV